jgi:hypothetical protein
LPQARGERELRHVAKVARQLRKEPLGFLRGQEADSPRPAGETQQWTIAGVMHGPMKMTLRINGEQIFDAGMDDELAGIYRDRPVRTICTTHAGFIGRADMSCQAYISGELAANLFFIKG